ncbi:uncharacterized protein LOC135368345 isoform X2 [Ornithodoros turicata]|uniref:uncharacterized protein LOC135368345 isoform X2 n=1 Tax=Ornithodoros turicata TaxID=34597 RepID=UPI0031391107
MLGIYYCGILVPASMLMLGLQKIMGATTRNCIGLPRSTSIVHWEKTYAEEDVNLNAKALCRLCDIPEHECKEASQVRFGGGVKPLKPPYGYTTGCLTRKKEKKRKKACTSRKCTTCHAIICTLPNMCTIRCVSQNGSSQDKEMTDGLTCAFHKVCIRSECRKKPSTIETETCKQLHRGKKVRASGYDDCEFLCHVDGHDTPFRYCRPAGSSCSKRSGSPGTCNSIGYCMTLID